MSHFAIHYEAISWGKAKKISFSFKPCSQIAKKIRPDFDVDRIMRKFVDK